MTLKEQIILDLKDAMRSGDTLKRDTLRMLDSSVKNVEIEKQKREAGLNDEEVLEVIARAVKQRQDSIRQFVEGGREDLAEGEKKELEILLPYLPEQLGDDELKKVIEQTISEMGATSAADLGKVMGQAMSKVKGKADGNRVRQIAQELLAK